MKSSEVLAKSIKNMRIKHSVVLRGSDGSSYFIFGSKALQVFKKDIKLFDSFRIRALTNDFNPLTTDELLKYSEVIQLCLDLNLFFKPNQLDSNFIPKKDCISIIESAFEMWRPIVNVHPFFELIDKQPTAFAKYLIEVTYFTKAASGYMNVAIQNSKDPIKKIVINWEKEERDHYKSLLSGLSIPEKIFENHDPNEGTVAIISHLNMLALHKPISFIISTSFFESQKNSKKFYKKFFSRHLKEISYDSKPFYLHQFVDADLDHNNNWKKTIPSNGMKAEVISEVISDLHMTKHMIYSWHTLMQLSFRNFAKLDKKVIKPINLIKVKPIFGAI